MFYTGSNYPDHHRLLYFIALFIHNFCALLYVTGFLFILAKQVTNLSLN
jgi:hypothetical protein